MFLAQQKSQKESREENFKVKTKSTITKKKVQRPNEDEIKVNNIVDGQFFIVFGAFSFVDIIQKFLIISEKCFLNF